MAPPVKSSVWSNFIKIAGGGKCKLCLLVVKTKGNTTNLTRHMKRHHPVLLSSANTTSNETDQTSQHDNLEENVTDPEISYVHEPEPSTSFAHSTPKKRKNSETKQPQIDETFSGIASFSKGGIKEGKVTNAILYCIAVDDLPLNTTEKTGFQYLMKVACPHYSLLGRKSITKLMDEKYDFLSNLLKNKLKEVESFCLTTDVWTDTMNTRSYAGLTCHFLEIDQLKSVIIGVQELENRHTANYLSSVIRSMCQEWFIQENKILAAVTDNGANIVKAIHDFLGRKKHLPCFAHTLNLVVQKSIENTSGFHVLINKVKEIVTYFKQCVHANDGLSNLQKNVGLNVKKLVQDVITRWNSTFYMLDRFIELSEYVGTVLLQHPKGPSMLTAVEIAVIKEIINILRPVENVTKEISAQNYATSSIVIPLIYCMTKTIESTNTNEISDIGSEFKAKMLLEIKKRFQNIEKVHILAISTILDPRFKKIYFTDAEACAKAINEISVLTKSQDDNNSKKRAEQLPEEDIDNSNDLWKFHSQLVSTLSTPAHEEILAPVLKQYLSEPLLDRRSDPIKYWSARKVIWAALSTTALRFLSVVATSVPSERLFSSANLTLSESRNRLDPQRISKLLFLKSLKIEDWHL